MPGPRTVRLSSFQRARPDRPTIKKVKVLGNQRVTAGGMIKRAKRRAASIKKKAPRVNAGCDRARHW